MAQFEKAIMPKLQQHMSSFTFVDDPDKEKQTELFTCLICRGPAHDPVVCNNSSCDQMYCGSCAKQVKGKPRKCPNCRKNPFKPNLVPRMIRLLLAET